MSIEEIGLYIHSPWCWQKCPYCDFNAYRKPANHEDFNIQTRLYLNALKKDLLRSKSLFPFLKKIKTIYLGGGTPSLFPPSYWEEVFSLLEKIFVFVPDIEITMEVSPKTSLEDLKAYYDLGIHRFSVGLQSFSPSTLKLLGREHDPTQSYTILEKLLSLPSPRINVDLIYGLAEQSPEDVMIDLKTALSFGITHLSWYELMIEPNTVFAKYPHYKANEDLLEEQELAAASLLESWDHYEISAYCRDGHYSAHNTLYWTYGDYLGIGAGAHSKITTKPYGNNPLRFHKTRYPQNYIQSPAMIFDKSQQAILDYLLCRLRLFQPLSYAETQQAHLQHLPIWISLEKLRKKLPQCFVPQPRSDFIELSSLGKKHLSTLLMELNEEN